ncbi:hypothetical protein E2562_006797 [Oryza meyeriana var. granulata]|uniref:Sulfotransferase n=1 Tax=Oryza meyeriana var. granulata TaxID=110450 RepID=A0A6G1C4I3_9ORYZ|nr:hypothetical protein E2562_006797 [Oryza meyeriana var. granulata]
MAASASVHGEDDAMDMAKLAPSLPLETRTAASSCRRASFPRWRSSTKSFETRPSDVFLASFPKSGTTWLTALAFETVNRHEHLPSGEDHPVRLHGPHDGVMFFEPTIAAAGGSVDMFAALPSPRLLSTHIPYSLLPEHVTASSSGSRIVYICRDPKDALVSGWLFSKKNMATAAAGANCGNLKQRPPASYTIDAALELFCDGRCIVGPC